MRSFNSRNVFDLSHEVKLTCEMGKLVPILCEEVVPGDVFRVSSDMVVRMAPMLAPIMHNVNIYTHFFFVPNRLIFDDWENFITGGKEGKDSTVAPTIAVPSGGFATSSLADYLGVPTGVSGVSVSALPFRAYAKIYNDYYRDENLQSEVALSTAAGVDSTTNKDLLTRAWQHDFFTDCLPYQQRGVSPALPLSGNAPVIGVSLPSSELPSGYSSDANMANKRLGFSHSSVPPTDYTYMFNRDSPSTSVASSKAVGLEVDLSAVTAATINDLRYAFQVQRFLEKNMRSGVRYIESILSHFGVKSSDARLQRPEYLGGGKSPIMISDVLQQSADDGQPTPLGTMAGYGFSSQRSHQFKKFFEEHGFVIGIMSIMPRSTYQQGLEKKWTRSNRYDYYWPVFAHLGEQAVKNKEIYLQADSVVDTDGNKVNDNVFGYQPRYQEYRKKYSSVHGDFRSSLDFWHLGRIFSTLPKLNSDFIKCDPDNRIFAVTSANDHMWVDIFHRIKAVRPIPKYGDPGYIDHD